MVMAGVELVEWYQIPHYIGKTRRSLKTQISEHRSNIRTGETKHQVAAHFVPAGHPMSISEIHWNRNVKDVMQGGGDIPSSKGIFLDSQAQHTVSSWP